MLSAVLRTLFLYESLVEGPICGHDTGQFCDEFVKNVPFMAMSWGLVLSRFGCLLHMAWLC